MAKQMSRELLEAERGWKMIISRASPELMRWGDASKQEEHAAHLKASLIAEK